MSYMNAKVNADSVHPVIKGRAVTASDTTMIPLTRALWIGSGGTVVIAEADGTTVTTYTNVPSGYMFPVQATQVRAATTATAIVAIY